MAAIMTKRGSQDNVVTYEHICDTRADMASIEDKYATLGSTCIVIQGESGGMEVYIADSGHQWSSLISGNNNESGNINTSIIHICANDEVDANGLPDIDEPQENMIYLVSVGNDTNNLFKEYLYVNDTWELIGTMGANIDLSSYLTTTDAEETYAPILNPHFSNSISLGRTPDTTVGVQSTALGYSTKATASYSYAEGISTTASQTAAHAEGNGTVASGFESHAEGSNTVASYNEAHAEGYASRASGSASHAEGSSTNASGTSAHSEGNGTVASASGAHAEGSGTQATSANAHSEGGGTQAYGAGSHAEGGGSAAFGWNSHAEGGGSQAHGYASHADGNFTIALGYAEHVSGNYNLADSAPSWTANTTYSVGDLISREVTFNDDGGTKRTHTVIYKCTQANSDTSFNSSHWTESGKYLFVVGNGTDDQSRSNAFSVDWNGNATAQTSITIGNTTINEAQLQALLAMLNP